MRICFSKSYPSDRRLFVQLSASRLIPLLSFSLGLVLAAAWLINLNPAAAHPVLIQALVPGEVYCVKPGGGSYPVCNHVYTTVQAALNAATIGEEIRVMAGRYTGTSGIVANITKKIKLLGGWNSDFTVRNPTLYPTILDGRRLGRVVQITGSIAPTLDGFTITGGNANNESFNPGKGGGIFVSLAGPIIQNNVITDNIAYTGTTPLGIGGGIYLLNCTSSTVISANQIISNTGSTNDWGLGGGLAAQGSSLKIIRNEIRNNFADRGGGGIYLHGDGAVILDANTIISNLSTFSPTAQSNGGAIYIEFLSPFTMTNNIIAGNGANFHGGGIYIYGVGSDVSTGSLINNTLADNKLGANDEGLSLSGYVTVTLVNNIIANHSIGLYAGHFSIARSYYTLFYQNTTANTSGPGSIISLHTISGLDPLFFSQSSSNYHLHPLSPAIDAGDPAGSPPAPAFDIDGDPRPLGLDVDIGADEARFVLFVPALLKSASP